MLSLSIPEIEDKLFYDELPSQYRIVDSKKLDITALLKLIDQFNDEESIVYFLNALAQSKTILLSSAGTLQHCGIKNLIKILFKDINLFQGRNALQQKSLIRFARQTLNKDELVEVLRELSPQAIYDIYLADSILPADSLIPIFNDRKILASMPINTQKITYRYLSRFHTADRTPFIEMEYFAARFSHTLGLNGVFTDSSENFKVSFEAGEFQHFSMTVITEHLEKYTLQNPDPAFAKILEAYQFPQQLLQQHAHTMSPQAAAALHARYAQNKLVLLPTRWPHHTFGIALYGDYLVHCNRGDGRQSNYTCAIFKLKKKPTIWDMKKLVANFNNTAEFNTFLGQFIDFGNPIYSFHNKNQKYPTCTYANLKSLIGPLSALVEVKPDCKQQKLLTTLKTTPHRRQYKQFTHFCKGQEINLLIDRMQCAKSPVLIRYYAFLAKRLLKLHPGKGSHPIKAQRERKRALYLIKNIPPAIMAEIAKDDAFVCWLLAGNYNVPKLDPPPGFTGTQKVYLQSYESYAAAPSASMDSLVPKIKTLTIKF